MITSKEFVQLFAVVLLIGYIQQGCLVRGVTFYEPNSTSPSVVEEVENSLSVQQQQQQSAPTVLPDDDNNEQQPQQVDNRNGQDNLKRFLLKDLDLDGYTLKEPVGDRRFISVNQLLAFLASGIPTQSPFPLFRSGRASGLSLGLDSPNRYSQQTRQPTKAELEYLNQQQQLRKGFPMYKPYLKGMEWSPSSRPPLANYRYSLRPQLTGSQRIGTPEVLIHTSMHSPSVSSDYEWKRVESSRNWNNLRGMWGK